MERILVSGCLYGYSCRYDGRSKPCDHPVFLKWKEEGRLVPVCPETDGGLPVPRDPCQRCDTEILTEDGRSCTAQYRLGAEMALAAAREQDVVFCIMKEGSPSCGVNEIYDGSFTGRKTDGEGLATELLRKNGFKVFSENELTKAAEYLSRLKGE